MNLASGASVIGRVRVRYTTSDPLSAELRAGSLVRTAHFDVPGLPPPSILCVRRVADPLPGQIRLERWQLITPRQWNRAVTDTLTAAWHAAVRPALEPVPDHAEAVWFADRAELLAALAKDWVAGAVGRHWWWRNLVSPADTTGVFRQWESAPEFVPAAIEVLGAQGCIFEFIRRLPSEFAGRLLERVLASHGVAWPPPDEHALVAPEPPMPPAKTSALPSPPPPPWRDFAAGSHHPLLSAAQETLLGVALILRREPARIRSAAFVKAYREWLSNPLERPAPVLQDSPRDPGLRASPHPDIPIDEIRTAPFTAPAVEPDPEAAVKHTSPACAAFLPKTDSPVADTFPKSTLPPHEIAADVRTALADRAAALVVSDEPAVEEQPSAIQSALELWEPPPAALESRSGDLPLIDPVSGLPSREVQITATEFGGLLFVLNAAVALGFFSDFTAPLGSNLDINPWDLLTLAGDEWCGEGFRADPIGTVLAELACRPIEKSPAGLPPGDRTIEMLAEWIASALQMEPDAASAFLVKIPARITTTLTHVDAFFSLQQHPIEIRFAGLDRNPGWIPAAGRYVAFHFD